MKRIILILALLSFPCAFFAVNVKDFGAKGDGKALDTKQIQQAIDQLASQGGGELFFPPGNYLSGTLFLKDNITLHLSKGATLLGSVYLEDYPVTPSGYVSHINRYTNRSLIFAENAHNISIVGEGTIDGQGSHANFKAGENDKLRSILLRPYVIRIISCEKVNVNGIQLKNSPAWMQHYLNCSDVCLQNLRIINHGNYNNDGIDIDNCRQVRISGCNIDADDDGICFKSTNATGSCEDVVVSDCIIASNCNAIKIGTETNGGFYNFAINNCVLRRPEYPTIYNRPERALGGIVFSTVDGATIDGISVNNISMTGVMTPLFLRLANRGRNYYDGGESQAPGILRNVHISNVFARTKESVTSSITGIPGHPVENIFLSNIHFICDGGGSLEDAQLRNIPENEKAYPETLLFQHAPAYGFFIRHAQGIRMNNICLETVNADCRKALYSEDVHDLTLSAVNFPLHWGDSLNRYVMQRFMPAEKYRWNWGEAVYLRALAGRWEKNIEKESALQYIRQAMDLNFDKAEGIHPNAIASGFGMAFLARVTGEEKYRQKAFELYGQYQQIPLASNGGVSHRDNVVELWDDTVYMISLFLLEMYRLTNDEQYLQEVARQLLAHAQKLEDKKIGFWYHGWDNDNISTDDQCCMPGWADNKYRRNNECWGRGNGWVAMTLANTLHEMPKYMKERKQLVSMFQKMMKALLPLQDPETGHWYQLPLYPGETGNFIESSCTAMFACAMQMGINDKLLPVNTYFTAVERAKEGLVKYSIKKNKDAYWTITNVCAGTCIGNKDYYYKRKVVEGTSFALGAAIMLFE